MFSLFVGAAMLAVAPVQAAVIYQSSVSGVGGTADLYDDLYNPVVGNTGTLWATVRYGRFSYAEWIVNGERQALWWEDIGEDEPYLNGNEYDYSPACAVTPDAPYCGTTPLRIEMVSPGMLRISFVRPPDFNYCTPFPGYGDCAESYRFTHATFNFIAEVDGPALFRIHDTNPLPEPATWAMFVGGFGLVGGVMRARKRTAVTA